MNPRMEVIFGAYIGIEDGKIVSIERKPPAEAPKAIVDGTGMVAIPGLINCHTHLATASLRCFTDDLGNTEALQALLQKEAKMDSRSAKAAASLAIAECLRFGVTSVSDLYYYPNATAEAVAESGIKANLALSSYRFIDENEDFDFETDEQCRELVKVTESTPSTSATTGSGKVWWATPQSRIWECSCILRRPRAKWTPVWSAPA